MKILTNEKNILKNMLILCGLFLIPTFLEHIINLGIYKQLIIGTIVNASLIACSVILKSDNKKIMLLSCLPSVSTICSGLLFSGLTYYSKVMIPFIWLGNLSLVYLYKYLYLNKNNNYFISGLISILLKVFIIYGGYLLLSNLLNFPAIVKETLSLSMGIYQAITALSGMLIIYLLRLTTKK